MKRHNLIRDFLVYTVSTVRYFFKERKFSGCISDILIFPRWYAYRNTQKNTLDFKVPWLVFGAIDFLQNYLTPKMKVFEYGSGGSTLFLGSRVCHVFSVEHDKDWFLKTREALQKQQLNNVTYNLIEPEWDGTYENKRFNDPKNNLSSLLDFKGKTFTSYVSSIDKFPDEYFDTIIVDGRARQSCIRQSIPKVKRGGVILLDNAERKFYLAPFPELQLKDKWRVKEFIGHFPFAPASVLNKTMIFIKQ